MIYDVVTSTTFWLYAEDNPYVMPPGRPVRSGSQGPQNSCLYCYLSNWAPFCQGESLNKWRLPVWIEALRRPFNIQSWNLRCFLVSYVFWL